ncbi:hypothetical protein ACJ4V0_00850 [Phreatobacter sp. HK31-P]
MTRPLLASLAAALAFAAIAPASAQTPTTTADFVGRWTSTNRDEISLEIRSEGPRIAAVRRYRTDGTVCAQVLSGAVAAASRTVTLDERNKCENGANGSGAAACSMRLTGPDRMSLTCPDINPRSFRRAAR